MKSPAPTLDNLPLFFVKRQSYDVKLVIDRRRGLIVRQFDLMKWPFCDDEPESLVRRLNKDAIHRLFL